MALALAPLLLAAPAPFGARGNVSDLFNCPSIQVPPLATDIAHLHPGHVSVVMAVGDSITAAFAARATPWEDRDLSWSIGVGTKDEITLPWLLSQYTDAGKYKLEGMST